MNNGGQVNSAGDHLTAKLQRYVENISRGMDSFTAAKAAAYSDSYARVIATRMKKNPVVAQAVERIRAEGMKLAVYDLATAMKEAEDVCVFAKLHKNAMAYCKGTELRAKLSGLLVDKVEVVSVDLNKALEQAEKRVLNASTVPPGSLPSRGSIDWIPRIPGSSIPDTEAGPAEDESARQVNNGGPQNR